MELVLPFDRLLKELTPLQLKRAMRSAYRAEGNKVRKDAVAALHAQGYTVKGNKVDFDKSISARVYSRLGGFMVTAAGNKRHKKGFHVNRYGQTKPIVQWLDAGTKPRRTKTQTKIFKRARRGHFTGSITAGNFMADAENKARGYVVDDLEQQLEKKLNSQARKAGLI